YLKAMKVRTLVAEDYAKAFEQVDVILAPVAPTTAFKIGEMAGDPLQMYLQDACTVPLNLAGLPGISIPCGMSSKGMPIGMQLIGKALDEETIIRAAYTYEQSQDYHKQMPQLGGNK
ncbi:MAG: Asp-tRNA(Asn)/Glu-tRNA(Gln) amidotransferase subunit GatA, partial [Selenomonas sp.]|nr:Asp-tRNA(Asn)/Glu-tRNA(Gln) amidotransferase subunit GatA [Selenomonas sp.]